MSAKLVELFKDLDRGKLRIRRPSRFIFFCGGKLSQVDRAAGSLRHYLLRDRKIEGRLDGFVVLAEEANQLYRDTDYHDLITFEEDIARISSMILVVAESEGALAELGAFASNSITRPYLTIIAQEKFAEAESFIRFGPIERIKSDDPTRVGFYPWRTNKKKDLLKSSAKQHVGQIVKFINAGLKRMPTTFLYNARDDIQAFIVVYWIIYLASAITLGRLTQLLDDMVGPQTQYMVRRMLYCMKLAGWISSYNYSGQEYWFVCFDVDPIDKYAFKVGVSETDIVRRKSDVARALQSDLAIPRHVREYAIVNRRAP